MANVNIWPAAIIAMLPSLGIAVAASGFGRTLNRLVAVQLATAMSILILVAMTFAFDQPSFIDLPLCAALLNLPGSLMMAMILERWI